MNILPIIPFEPVRVEQFPTGSQWVAQVKWDGVRVLTYYDGKETKLFNRKLNERTLHYPELRDISKFCSAKSVVLDGEIIALKDGRPSFYEVMKRDGLKTLDKVAAVRKHVPITYMIFDVLYVNDKWVTSRSLAERQGILREIVCPGNETYLVDNFDDAKGLYQAIQSKNMEGIVLKDLTSTYLINGKDDRWRKKKFYRDLIAVVGAVTYRDKIVNSLLLGLFDANGCLWYIGHAGTGKLTSKEWCEVTKGIKPLIQSTMPFSNKPPRAREAVWLKPVLTVKVQFTEWIDGHTLRQPSIQSFVDVKAADCVFE